MTYEEKKRRKEEREKALNRMENIVDKAKRRRGPNANLTGREQRRFDEAHQEAQRQERELKKLERAHEPIARGAFIESETRDAEGRKMDTKLDREDRDALRAWVRNGETRAGVQSVGNADEGGRLASTILGDMIFEALERSGGVRGLNVRRFQTGTGETMRVPGLDDQGNSGSQVSEGSTIPNTTNILFSEVNLEAHTFQAGPVLASFELLDDSNFELEDIISDQLGGRIRRKVEPDLAGSTVTSSTAINGIVTGTSGAVSIEAGTTTLTLDDLRDLFFSVNVEYRESTNAAWAFTDKAYKVLTKLESGDGEPLVEPSLQAEPAPQLLGRPIRIVEDMGDIATSSQVPIMFGDWNKGYAVRDVMRASVLRLDQKYADNRQIGFLAWARSDGRPLFSSTIPASRRPIRGIVTT